jgi:hypothetical protein
MAIKDDFIGYFDGNGLLSPNPGVWTPGQKSSDNGVCFTSEYYIILKKNGQLTDQDKLDYQQKIGQCIDQQGMLNRVPIGQDDGLEAPDDYYGVLDGCMQLGNTKIPRQFLKALILNLGFLNNVNPGTLWVWPSFLARQLQLVTGIVAASFPSWKNPLHILARIFCWPLFVFSAAIIATSCIGSELSNTDGRRLSWHLWQTLKPVSFLCWLAGKVWLRRLYGDYGPRGMRTIASIYYKPHPVNPYSTWWITE